MRASAKAVSIPMPSLAPVLTTDMSFITVMAAARSTVLSSRRRTDVRRGRSRASAMPAEKRAAKAEAGGAGFPPFRHDVQRDTADRHDAQRGGITWRQAVTVRDWPIPPGRASVQSHQHRGHGRPRSG